MQSMTSLQLFVLFLSALRQMEAFKLDDSEDVADVDVFTFGHGLNRARTVVDCKDHDEVARWINEQVVRNAKMTKFNQQLSKLLNELQNNKSASTQEEHCCFYEKNAMENIFQDITNLTEKTDIGGNEPLKTSGDMGKDLDNILDRMKKIIGNDMKSCCEVLSKNLKELEDDLHKQLEDLKQKLNGTSNQPNQNDELKAKQAELEKKLNELKDRIDKLEEKLKGNAAGTTDAGQACCKDVEASLDDLRKQLESAIAENEKKATEINKELKDMKKEQEEHVTKINEIKKDLEKRVEDLKKVQENCDKTCGNKTDENATNGQNSTNEESNKRLDELEKLIKELLEESAKCNNLSETVSECKELNDRIASLEEKLKQFEEQNKNDSNNNNKGQCQPGDMKNYEELQKQIEKAKNCCQNIESLTKNTEELKQKMDQMNASYTEHKTQLDADIKDLQNRLNEALEKLKAQNQTANGGSTSGTGTGTGSSTEISDRIKQLQDALNAIKETLPAIQQNITNNDIKLNEAKDTSTKKFDELNALIAAQKKAFEEFKAKTEQRLDKLEAQGGKDVGGKGTESPSNGLLEKFEDLKLKYEELRRDTDKILQLEQRIKDLEKLLNEALEKMKASEALIGDCAAKCKQLDNIDDMIDLLEDMEKKIMHATPSKPNPTKAIPTKRTTKGRPGRPTRPGGKKNESIIGGVDT